MKPKLNAVLETSLYVDDLKISFLFYQKIFEFEEIFSNDRLCALNVSDQQVLLLFLKEASAMPSQTQGGIVPGHDGNGQLHLAFSIAEAELGNWRKWLQQNQIKIESEVLWPAGGISLYFRDPDMNSLELATPGLWPIY